MLPRCRPRDARRAERVYRGVRGRCGADVGGAMSEETSDFQEIKVVRRLHTVSDAELNSPRGRAVARMMSLALSRSIFGSAPDWEWARSQLTDAERAALAQEAQPPEWPALGDGDNA